MVSECKAEHRNREVGILDLETLYHRHSRQVLATLIRLLGEFDLAEEALQEAFAAAAQQWPADGVPDNPRAWLIRCGQNRGIDQIRRRQTVRRHADELAWLMDNAETPDLAETSLQDDQLRLTFTCCHPALAVDAQLALTLREVCGLTTEQVARALLQKPTTLAQKIVRAKRKIREAGIPYEVPEEKHLAERLGAVLHVIYLMFNEGYARTEGEHLIDASLAAEAIRLAELLATLLPDADVFGLIALMRLQDARKLARVDAHGELVTLEDQDRSLWDREQIRVGKAWLMRALAHAPAGAYTLQAAIAAAHAGGRPVPGGGGGHGGRAGSRHCLAGGPVLPQGHPQLLSVSCCPGGPVSAEWGSRSGSGGL